MYPAFFYGKKPGLILYFLVFHQNYLQQILFNL